MISKRVSTYLYFALSYTSLIIIQALADIPITIGNASTKANLLIHFKFPDDNFYPIGKAILLIPFLWNGPNYFIAILFYFSVGLYAYYKICENINNQKYRLIALLALPFNPYLIWLIYTSQDTVFEFALLLLLLYRSSRYNLLPIVIFGYLLCLTRPGYWPVFLFCVAYNLYKNRSKRKMATIIAFAFLSFSLAPTTLFVNKQIFGEANFAEESGVTAYFSYNKYLYLALPTFDMDVFLSTKGHGWSEDNKSSAYYTNLALNSIKKNPKQVMLASLEKVDAYVFDIQKVPHLPGEYFLSEDGKSIQIGDERLKWSLVIGNVLYATYRVILILALFFTIGAQILLKRMKLYNIFETDYWFLAMPWILGMIPGFIFYTETRFKITSEIILIPFIAIFWQSFPVQSKSKRSSQYFTN